VKSQLWNIPNLLSLSRLPLSVVLFVCIAKLFWLAGLIVFLIAMFTDWLDGWWARRYGSLTPIGRSLDPLTDKVLICGAFIYFLLVPESGILPWMVTVIISRELLITGLRGIVEAQGLKFGADWFGKLKTVLQSASIIGILLILTLQQYDQKQFNNWLEPIQLVLLYGMLFATIGSGLQYLLRAVRVLSSELPQERSGG
jgi:CDP-diacylglycerol---glycerol-3-phosphate 3-phosphatidyltransferase